MSEQQMKSNRGRPKNPVKRDEWHVRVDPEVSLFWRMFFHDEFTGTVRKNELSNLVTRLLREEMERKLKGGKDAG